MAYERVNWENLPSTKTPVNADNLNKMDEGIANIDTKINAKQDKLTAGTGIEITDENTINNINANYSTDEQVIGKWIDGKPLYRKVYTGTKVSGHNKTFTLSERNIDYVNFYGFITGNQGTTEGAYQFPINYYENSNAFIRANIHRKYMNLIIVSAESPYFNGDYIIVVEYTKTTD